MNDDDSRSEEIRQLETRIRELKAELAEKYRRAPNEMVADHLFVDWEHDDVRLSELFGPHDDLIVVHNMGKSCPYCTLWADGFNGIVEHLEDRAAFVVCSPDPPDIQRAFAQSRGWDFRMVSDQSGDFTRMMGFRTDDGYLPGVSTFRRAEDSIQRVAHRMFGPGDDFSALWHLFDLLGDGVDGWEPNLAY